MKQDIRLYLSGMLAELSEEPRLLFNYKITDTESPAAVRNSFTKSISLKGTDANNAIFGAMYDLGRLQTYGSGQYSGTDFNPLKKAEFELYVDSECYEKGYFKLTEIQKQKNTVTYTIQLFGGLGEFMQNLSESEGGNKLEFKDLRLVNDTLEPQDVDAGFTISKETVAQAWDEIGTYSSKYSTINFVPCYNGVPSDFDADHLLINLSGKTTTMNNITGITSYHRWAQGESSRELTEWETRDLRSYMQRPALRVKSLISTIALPENNGGFDVELDAHFFNTDNPYYQDAWVTLPMIKDIKGDEEESETITGATLSSSSTAGDYFYTIGTDADFSEYSNLSLELRVGINPRTATTAETLYTSTNVKVRNSAALATDFIRKYYRRYSALLLQLVAYDEIGQAVAASAAYQLTSDTSADFKDKFGSDFEIPEWKTLEGKFILTGGTWTWADMDGNPQTLRFSFPSDTSFRVLKFRLRTPYHEKYKTTGLFTGETSRKSTNGNVYYFPQLTDTVSGSHRVTWYHNRGSYADPQFSILDFSVRASRYGGFLSGKEIPADRVLTLGITPAEFLLSYTKLFGLHIWKDPVEKKIYIQDRNTFYKRDEIVDLHELIDRSKAMKITPQVPKTKWYDFNTEQNTSEANEQYLDTYGMEYGLQRVNTSWDFDAGTEKVYTGKFKGGVQVLENSRYYYGDFDSWPVFVYNGFTLTTFTTNGGVIEGTEHTVNTRSDTRQTPINATYEGYDMFDKPQFHSEDNSPENGALTLLFFTGMQDTGEIPYYITDDLEEMVSLNDKSPCWILTGNEYAYGDRRIAIRTQYIPKFSRYETYAENGYITHSWDFGRTLETYIPGTVVTEGSSIYEKFWKDYISDMYSVNSRILSCSVLLEGQVNASWLRRFYFFDNSWWRLNHVKEYNPGSYATTMCEFLKVNDIGNYSLERVTLDPIIDFYLPDYTGREETTSDYASHRYYTVPADVTAVTAYIQVQDGGQWWFGDGAGSYYSLDLGDGTTRILPYDELTASGADGGKGNTSETLLIGANTSESARTFNLNIIIYGASGDYYRYVHITQEAEEGSTGTINATRFGGTGNIPAEGGQATFTITSDMPWTGTTGNTWVTLEPSTGGSGSTVTVLTAEANQYSSTRPCAAYFTGEGGASCSVSVTQDGTSS